VGIVTSKYGAAIHDILRVARHRGPASILLSPAAVQGDGAARSLIQALQRLCTVEGVDVVIMGRGGGSIEDLWVFNDEGLVRAVAACPVPVVAAVGHEVDFTLIDFVADVRAATPSQAAEFVFPDQRGWTTSIEATQQRLIRAIERRVLDERLRLDQCVAALTRSTTRFVQGPRAGLDDLEQRLRRQHPRVRLRRDRQQLDRLRGRLARCGHALTARTRTRLARAGGALEGLSPVAVLERGYAVVTDHHGAALRRASHVEPGELVGVRLHRGSLRARVVDTDANSDAD
jgi:exodeoxyribonuclease VII large subunit